MEQEIKIITVENNPARDIPGHTLCTGKEIAGELLGIDAYSLKLGKFEEGGVADEHTHAVSEHVFYILTGALSVMADGKVYTAQAGEALYIPSGIPHAAENAFAGTTSYVALTIPPA